MQVINTTHFIAPSLRVRFLSFLLIFAHEALVCGLFHKNALCTLALSCAPPFIQGKGHCIKGMLYAVRVCVLDLRMKMAGSFSSDRGVTQKVVRSKLKNLGTGQIWPLRILNGILLAVDKEGLS